jgi:hypothetical protein
MRALIDGYGVDPEKFQLVYPTLAWNWPVQNLGIIDTGPIRSRCPRPAADEPAAHELDRVVLDGDAHRVLTGHVDPAGIGRAGSSARTELADMRLGMVHAASAARHRDAMFTSTSTRCSNSTISSLAW